MVTDRRTKYVDPGSSRCVEDSARQVMGVVAVNRPQIFCGLDRIPGGSGGETKARFEAHINAPYKLVTQMYDAPFYRFDHTRSRRAPRCLDRIVCYGCYSGECAWADAISTADRRRWSHNSGVRHVLKNASGGRASLEGLDGR